jgi:hypothetical protein
MVARAAVPHAAAHPWIARIVEWLTSLRGKARTTDRRRTPGPDEKALERWMDDGGAVGATQDRQR